MSRNVPEPTPAPEPVDPIAMGETAENFPIAMQALTEALAGHLGMTIGEVAQQIGRLVDGPKTPGDQLLVRLNARLAGRVFVPNRRPRR